MKVLTYDKDKLIADLNEYMYSNNLTNKMMSDMTGVDPAVISKLRRDIYHPPERTVEEIVITMGKTMEYYMSDDIIISIGENYIKSIMKLPTDTIEDIIEHLNDYLKVRKDKERKIQELQNDIRKLETEIKLLKD